MWQEITDTLSVLMSRLLGWTQLTLELYAPRIILALVTLVLAWLVASAVRQFTAKGLKAIGFDVVCERAGLREFLEKRQITRRPSVMIAWSIYIVILYTGLVLAVERLGINAIINLVGSLSALFPKLLVVAAILILGWLIAGWAGRLVRSTAKIASVPFFGLLGSFARFSVLIFTIILALDYLQLASRDVLLGTVIALLVFAIAAGVITVLCARELVGNLLARNFVSAEFKVGDKIRLREMEGEILSIGITAVRLKQEDSTAIIPNRFFLEESVFRLRVG
jgi:hypothetical protein